MKEILKCITILKILSLSWLLNNFYQPIQVCETDFSTYHSCRVCHWRAGTIAEKRYDSQWVKCLVDRCVYWAHSKYIGFWPKDDMRDLFYNW